MNRNIYKEKECVNKMSKKKGAKCFQCQLKIALDEEKYVLLGTYNQGKTLDESYFHFKCFKQWYNEKTVEKAQNSLNEMANLIKGSIPSVKKMMGDMDLSNFDVSGFSPFNINEEKEAKKKKNARPKKKS